MVIGGPIALALASSFGPGTRLQARDVMAGMRAHEIFEVGQRLEFGHCTGRLVSIGTVKTVIVTEPGGNLVTVPNRVLVDEHATIVADGK